MQLNNNQYSKMVKTASSPSPHIKNFLWAFLIGGFICALGEIFFYMFGLLGLSEKELKMAVPSALIIIAAILTGVGVFDKIAKRAGAGTLVPITGFANAVVSPAIEFKSEGWVLGLGANIFKIAGPVIAYGTVASVLYGIIYWITTMF